MCQYEMISANVEDKERTRFRLQTNEQTDGRTAGHSEPLYPIQHRWQEYDNVITKFCDSRGSYYSTHGKNHRV